MRGMVYMSFGLSCFGSRYLHSSSCPVSLVRSTPHFGVQRVSKCTMNLRPKLELTVHHSFSSLGAQDVSSYNQPDNLLHLSISLLQLHRPVTSTVRLLSKPPSSSHHGQAQAPTKPSPERAVRKRGTRRPRITPRSTKSSSSSCP